MTEAQARILLVDDDEAKRYLMSTWLRRAGHIVTEVGTGRDALDHVSAAELVLLDVNLPDMSGYDVCKLIKGDPATAAIPVVQISATAVQVSDRALGLTQGADAYLTDPGEPDELLAVVMAALRYSRARQRAERTALLLAALTEVALDISAASTFDGLARAAAAGAARIFAAQAVLIVQMPDGHIRRTSAMPGQPGTRQRFAHVLVADLEGIVIRADHKQTLAIDASFFRGKELRGRAVLVHTGWDQYWNTEQYFENHPYVTEDAAQYLLDCGVKLVGIDSVNIDDTIGKTRPVHSLLLKAEVLIVEHLCNLQQVPDEGFTFSALPPKFKGAGTFPVRALAKLR